MMQPDASGDEHEIIFDDEDDTEIISTHRRDEAPMRNRRPQISNHSQSIQHFQPFAENNVEAAQAAIRLESFLASPPSSNNGFNRETTRYTNDTTLLIGDDIMHGELKTDPTEGMFLQSNDKSVQQHITTSSTVISLAEKSTLDAEIIPSQRTNTTANTCAVARENKSTITSSFDPYATHHHNSMWQPMHNQNNHNAVTNNLQPAAKSLLDYENNEEDSEDNDVELASVTNTTCGSVSYTILSSQNIKFKTPGTVGFLEMEEEPPRTPIHNNVHMSSNHTTQQPYSIYDPIQTSTGLLLTHRRVPPPPPPLISYVSSVSSPTTTHTTSTIRTQFEMDCTGTSSKAHRGQQHSSNNFPTLIPCNSYPFSWQHHYPTRKDGGGNFPISLTPMLRYVRLWMVFSATILFFGTMVLLHHAVNAKEITGLENQSNLGVEIIDKINDFAIEYDEQSGIFHLHGDESIQLIPLTENDTTEEDTEQIILVPLPPNIDPKHHSRRRRLEQRNNDRQMVGVPALMQDYPMNHHGNSPLLERTLSRIHTLRNEFDSWMVQHDKSYDTEQERHFRFQIWSHNRERTIEKNERHGPCMMTGQDVFGSNHLQDLTSDEFKSQFLNGYYLSRDPIRKESPEREQKVLGLHIDRPPKYHPTLDGRLLQQRQYDSMGIDYQGGCKWYDVSCILRYIFSTFLYGLGGTMEPAYDANSYPTSMDWRSLGAVTSIHSQSSCGACWAITAVETVESAYFISTGKLYDLAETEVIVCETNGEMCAGGWPQDAFEYVIKNNGLPLESDMPYNADFLVLVSDQIAGNSDQLSEDTVSSYQQQTCPSGGGNDKHSGDSASVSGTNTFTRYGKIKGYGYSTSKCVCYTDGSGCDCDHQNEGYAVRNLATYGPAVVCLDASTWQDYTGGIITSDSGCSRGFMDVNHCVQAVGYAYVSDEEYDIEVNENQSGDKNQNSHSGSGSQDSTKRKGYWIVRNQWSTYWGMNGYAYVAMGENTCGILNDMMQAYT